MVKDLIQNEEWKSFIFLDLEFPVSIVSLGCTLPVLIHIHTHILNIAVSFFYTIGVCLFVCIVFNRDLVFILHSIKSVHMCIPDCMVFHTLCGWTINYSIFPFLLVEYWAFFKKKFFFKLLQIATVNILLYTFVNIWNTCLG